MARPTKNTVDYFPHSVQHGKTMFIIEERYGNDGYAFWFKLLESLGDADGHYLDLNDTATYEYLRSKTRRESSFLDEILNLLAKLDAIDPELWSKRVVWCQKFVDGISGVYTRSRHTLPPSKPDNYAPKPSVSDVSTHENPQSKVKKSKPPIPPAGDEEFFVFYNKYPKHKNRAGALKAWKKMNGNRPTLEILLNAIESQKQTDEWRKENGKYIPHPASWLNGKRWEDEIELPKPRSVFS